MARSHENNIPIIEAKTPQDGVFNFAIVEPMPGIVATSEAM